MNLEQKKAAVEDLKVLLNSSQAMFLLAQNGLSVSTMTQIRAALRKEGAGFRIVKNTMLARAIDGSPWEFVGEWLKGPLALAYTPEDPVGLAKAISAFLKTTTGMSVVGGALGTKPASTQELTALAALPSPEVVKGMLLGAFTATPKKLLGIFQAPARDFVGVLAARERQLAEQG